MPLACYQSMSRTRIALILAVLLAHVALARAQTSSSNPLDAGFQAIQNAAGDTAATIFKSALARDPKDPRLLFGAGLAAHLQGREHDALSLLKQALQYEPRMTQAAAILGEIAYHEGDLDLAIR